VRVLCCYTDLRPETKAALPPGTELAWTGADDFAYWREITARWDGTDALVIVEHDIEIHEQVIGQFAACPAPWCTFPYFYGPDRDPSRVMYQALGCAKFSAQCQRDFPAGQIAASVSARDGTPPRPPWHSCDTYICRALLHAGIATCLHEPWVTHHGTY
jgi:hypothetical protein